MSDIAVKKIVLGIGKKEIELTEAEAMELQRALNRLLASPIVQQFYPYYAPTLRASPILTYTTGSGICGGTSGNLRGGGSTI